MEEGYGNAGRGIVHPDTEVSQQDDRAQFYVLLGKIEFEGVMLSEPKWLLFCLIRVVLIRMCQFNCLGI